MTNIILKIFLYIAIAVLQVTLMPLLAIHSVWPNLVLIIAVLLLLLNFEEDAYLIACVGGLVLDLTGVLPLGLNTIFLIALITLLKIIIPRFFPESNAFIIFVTVFASSLIFSLFQHLILSHILDTGIIIEAIYAGVLAEIILYLFRFKKDSETLIKVGEK